MFCVERVIYGAAMGRRRDIILLLHTEGPMPLAKLRDALKMSASTLLFELSALEKLGVVKREGSLVFLTELGERVASIISTVEPLKSLSFLSLAGLRPLVVWLLLSPLLPLAAATLLAGWVTALAVGSFLSPPLSMIYVMYVGHYLPSLLSLSPPLSLIVSLISVAGLLLGIYSASRRRLGLSKIVAGLFPLAIYPTVHLALVWLAQTFELSYLVAISQVLLFVSLLLTATVFATVYSIEMGATYETSLIRSLLAFFVVPALLYLAPLR
ncbi:ArsR family transcriptional regulator [Pyrobaculum sp.]|uniref:ArsR family transcriptional regulator n=1 Tax=Pyrobaculum sp. TaxID=2004705 RepID=UPI00316658D4